MSGRALHSPQAARLTAALASAGAVALVERWSGRVSLGLAFGVAAALLGAGVWAWAAAGRWEIWLVSLPLAWALIVLAVVDARVFRLPDAVTLPLTLAGLLAAIWVSARPWSEHVVGAATGYLALAGLAWLYRRVRGRDGLGLGDAKLLAAAGAWLTWRGLPSVVLIGAAGALLWALAQRLRRPDWSSADPLPFGAPLCLAVWWVWLHGPVGAA